MAVGKILPEGKKELRGYVFSLPLGGKAGWAGSSTKASILDVAHSASPNVLPPLPLGEKLTARHFICLSKSLVHRSVRVGPACRAGPESAASASMADFQAPDRRQLRSRPAGGTYPEGPPACRLRGQSETANALLVARLDSTTAIHAPRNGVTGRSCR